MCRFYDRLSQLIQTRNLIGTTGTQQAVVNTRYDPLEDPFTMTNSSLWSLD
jgi:hypothetical protein